VHDRGIQNKIDKAQAAKIQNLLFTNFRKKIGRIVIFFISSFGQAARIMTSNKHKANDPNPAHPDAQKHLASFLTSNFPLG
jgi:hypothetical protein